MRFGPGLGLRVAGGKMDNGALHGTHLMAEINQYQK